MDQRRVLVAAVLADAVADDDDVDNGAVDISDNDDDDDEENHFEVQTRKWMRMGDPTFKTHFRMDRCIFETLVVTVGRYMVATGRIIRKGMPISLSLMMTLWIMATPNSFRCVGEQFGLAKGSVHNQYKTMIEVLCEMRGQFIRWPTEYEAQEIARRFEDNYGYPSVSGCIDGCHIRCTAPLEQPQRYVNRHHDFSILLQGVCDDRLLFIDVFVGQPGAVGDVRTFQRSPLCNRILRQPGFMGDLHLLGDGAYRCTDKMLTPYRDYGNLTERQRTHNYFLSRCRACIERAFALLKGKWRRLKYFPHYCLEYMLDTIIACIVLHNFIILEGEPYEDEEDVPLNLENVDVPTELLLIQASGPGERKREYIATMLHPVEQ